jgi:hypothetical protein
MPSTYPNPTKPDEVLPLANPNRDLQAITSASLSPQPTVNYSSPAPTPVYPVAGLNNPNAALQAPGDLGKSKAPSASSTFNPTAPELQAQNATNELMALNDRAVGESAYRSEQETAQGIPGLNQNIIQTAALRNNAIQALSVNSLLEASRGNLTTALDMVDRAVAQKFDPIKEEIAAKTANLNLILNSPEYSLADKKRAQAQLEIQQENARAIETQEKDMRDIQDIALKAATLGASGVILQAIQAAKSPLEAIQIAAEYGALTPETKPNLQTVKLDSGETVVVDMNTGQRVNSLGGGSGSGGVGSGTTSSPLRTQPGYSTLTAKQKNQADSLNNLVRTLNDYRDYYNQNPGAFGGVAGNLFGQDSGLIQTKVNSIIFAAAQAEGTGALQQADREVIERIIPNPSSFGGALNTLFKGGKEGNLQKLDDQIQKYTENLGTYGLTPMADPSPNGQPKILVDQDGQQLDASELTASEYAEAIRDGYTPL